ncbi:hypothetical protein ACFZEN_002205, partial [Salmonella enterica]
MKNYRLSDFFGLPFLCGVARFFIYAVTQLFPSSPVCTSVVLWSVVVDEGSPLTSTLPFAGCTVMVPALFA